MGRGRCDSHSSSTQRTCSTKLLDRSVGEDAVGEARGAADGRLGATADQNRDARRGPGPDTERREVVQRALVAERLAAPRLREDPQDLLHRSTAPACVGAEPRELDLRPSEAEAQDQPPVAQQLDRRRILRQAERMVHRGEDDARAELDPRRRLRKRRADDEERGHVPVIDEVVLGRPHRREAEPLRLDRQPDGLVVGARPVGLARPELRAEESEAESHGPRR